VKSVDLVHAVGIGIHSFAAYQFAKRIRKPFLLQLIGGDTMMLSKEDVCSNNFPFRSLISSEVFANSQSLAVHFSKLMNYDVLVRTIYRGVNLDNFRFDRNAIRADSKMRFLYLGGYIQKEYWKRGKDVKGGFLLLKAWKYCDSVDLKNAELIVGGPYVNEIGLQEFSKSLTHRNSIRYIGHVDSAEVPTLLNYVDVLVIPSLSEGLPNILLEAMAAEKLVVCFDVGGIKEIVQDAINGFILPPLDYVAFGKKIIEILKLPIEARNSIGLNAKETIAKNFNSKNYGASVEEVYETLCKYST